MLKKLLSILLAALFVVSFAGCKSSKDTSDTSSETLIYLDENGNEIVIDENEDDKTVKETKKNKSSSDDDDTEIIVQSGSTKTKKSSGKTDSSDKQKSGGNSKEEASFCKHKFSEATCSKPKTCSICGATEGTTLPHTPDHDATCLTPSTCKVCKQVITKAKGHTISGDVCSVCGVPAKDMSKSLFIGDEVFNAVGNKFSRNGVNATVISSENKTFLSTVNGNVLKEKYVSALAESAIPDNFGYVIMDGGINDCKYVEAVMGSVTPDSNRTDFDTKTVAGGLEQLFSEVVSKYPNAKKGFVITYKIGATDTGRWSELKKLAKKACNKWGISYVDLEELDGFSSEFSGKFVESDRPYIPNSAGSEVIAKYVCNWMNGL